MTRRSVREYLAAQRARYGRATRAERHARLDEIVAVTGYHRKAVIRHLRQCRPPRPGARPVGRPRQYGPAVAAAATVLWEAAGQIGAKRLQPFIPALLERLTACGELRLAPGVADPLRQASVSTLERLLAPARRTTPRRGPSLTRPGSWLKRQIPIRTFAEWDDARPGFVEADLVAHCGQTTTGFFLHTLCAVDIVTGWVELQPVWGKGQYRVTAALHEIRTRLPVPLRGLDTDNGPEFIGRAFAQWADTHDVRLHFITPGKPVQNAYIESFHGRFRDECLNGAWFLSLADARRVIEAWRQDYNTVRPHSALGYITPAEFEQLSPNGEWGTQPAEQKEARCSTPPPHASLGAPEAP